MENNDVSQSGNISENDYYYLTVQHKKSKNKKSLNFFTHSLCLYILCML